MIELIEEDEDYTVLVGGKAIDVEDAGEDYVLALCDVEDLKGVSR